VTLFPGGGLPLHVFEPRYRNLVADALAGDRVVALPRLEPGYTQAEYQGRPPVAPFLGVGVIVESERFVDGRYQLVVRGVARARIAREHAPERTYREAELLILEDLTHAVTSAAAEALAGCLVELSRCLDAEGARALGRVAALSDDPARLADHAAALLLPTDACQDLMGELDPQLRVERVTELLAELLLSARVMPAGRPS
jgi:Lon protease-like protein